MTIILSALLLIAAVDDDQDTSQCAIDRMSEQEQAVAGTELFEGTSGAGQKALLKALNGCAKARGWNDRTLEVISRGASLRLLYDRVIIRFGASNMPLDLVGEWLDRQPPETQVANEITTEMVQSLATEMMEAGVSRETLQAESRAIGVALFCLIDMRRMQNGLPQFGS